MIKDISLYQGAVFSELIRKSKNPLSIESYAINSYVLNSKIGLHIKYSSKRISPWVFNFHKEHQDEILDLKKGYVEVFISLVCNNDGIVLLSFDELKKLLDENHQDNEAIRISRRHNEKYRISGSDSEDKIRIGQAEFPKKILYSIEKN